MEAQLSAFFLTLYETEAYRCVFGNAFSGPFSFHSVGAPQGR